MQLKYGTVETIYREAHMRKKQNNILGIEREIRLEM